ncbi:hypothetical protein B7P43_G18208 [Cryptotermes secundus]|uniref:Hexosyltransferase n=1 Tax=Cryptotermes secundus TaxID=105785 RepID=A0A2J7QK23_9NEOP|nr:hypothetical protein B7P43_G18208 [Cryptotermes secundus]
MVIDTNAIDVEYVFCTEKINLRSGQNNDPILGKATRNHSILIILILTSPANVNRREIIRGTWLSLWKNSSVVQYHFVVGGGGFKEEIHSFIAEEQSVHHDLIVLPHVYDDYKSLTKKVLEAFVWIDKAVNHFKYLLKCDDDSFVQVDKVLSELQTLKLAKEHSLYWGFFNGRAQVKVSGKWKESDWVLCDYYLPYALGGGYVLSQKLIHFIAVNAKFLRLYNSEDVSVGVWLSAVANVTRLHDPRFDTEFMSRGCSNTYLVTHKHDATTMRKMFVTLKESGRLCDVEYRTRDSYMYNWNVPPSKCCIRNDSSIP